MGSKNRYSHHPRLVSGVMGLITFTLGFFRIKILWKIGKIQAFVQILGERGAQVFFSAVGLAAALGGMLILNEDETAADRF